MRLRTKQKKLIFVTLAIIAVVLLFDAAWYEPRHPVLVVHNVRVPGLPKSMDGLRLVQISDVHRRRIVPDVVIKRAVNMANSTKPDIVVLTGDYEGKQKSDIEPCFRMLGKIKAKYGVFAVLGNHDYWTGAEAVSDAMRRHGVKLLKNANRRLGKGVYLCGIDDSRYGCPNAVAALDAIPDNASLIMLSHNPDALDLFKNRRGLMLSGHSHGGQIQLPLSGKWRYPGIRNWRFKDGWYREGNIQLYVNQGIGMINPGVRFQCRPEVTLFILHPQK